MEASVWMVWVTMNASVQETGVVAIVSWDHQFSYRQSRVSVTIAVMACVLCHRGKWNMYASVLQATQVRWMSFLSV